MSRIALTREHNTQPIGAVLGGSELRWILLKQDNATIMNISLIDYRDNAFAKKVHDHLYKAMQEFVRLSEDAE